MIPLIDKQPGGEWLCGRGHRLPLARPLIMGVLNVTPDSFSDGGRFLDSEAAVAHAQALVAAGADLLDLGAESTRPGAAPVDTRTQCRRLLPVVEALAAQRPSIPLSIDTTSSAVAAPALAAGAAIINDISAGRFDPDLFPLVARNGAGMILMHMRGTPRTMQDTPHYDDVVAEVRAELLEATTRAMEAGIPAKALSIDPGIGFGKTTTHNLALLAHLDRLVALGWPVVVGFSRKRFLGELTGQPVDARQAAGLAVGVWCVQHGAAVIRVHDVAETRDALILLAALAEARAKDASGAE